MNAVLQIEPSSENETSFQSYVAVLLYEIQGLCLYSQMFQVAFHELL